MVSLITTGTHVPKFHHSFLRLNYHPISHLGFLHNTKRNHQKHINLSNLSIFTRSVGFEELRRVRKLGNSWCLWCKNSEEDIELESEIMGFMEKSEKPSMFPTKGELIKAGRMDLLEAIKRKGGWYSLGWDEENEWDNDNVDETRDFDVGEFQKRVESHKESASLKEHSDSSLPSHEKEDNVSFEVDLDLENSNFLQLKSLPSLGRSQELDADNDAGIEGILRRLEKQRNKDLGINLGKYGNGTLSTSKHDQLDMNFDTFKDVARTDLDENGRFMPGLQQKGLLNKNTSNGKIGPNADPKNWWTWSSQRAGSVHTEFEAAEICFSKVQVESDTDTYYDGSTIKNEEYSKTLDKTEETYKNHIQTRLQHLEYELNTALSALSSQRLKSISEEEIGSSNDVQKLSDAWEFQENEFMSAKERLRSIRAKLAVLEGKMTLAIINAQKTVEEKQKQIDGAHNALQLLRPTCVVWPNSASEVLLVGSFDGWTTQRKLEKSRTGIFSIYLKLYPGKYEIKFIVDGIWKVDPLRPIVNNNGHENNLLVIT